MKKINLIALIVLFVINNSMSQNVGIGTNTPTEKLDVNGGIKIGSTNNTSPGTIRWNASKNDFEGYNGSSWVSLTGSKGNWGSNADYVHESTASDIRLQFNPDMSDFGKHLGSELGMANGYLLAGAYGDYGISSSIPNVGSVRILKKENGLWKHHQALYAPGTVARAQFGCSIAADGNIFIVGANATSVGSNAYQGRAYIYGMNGDGTPVLQATLTASNGTGVNYFGSSVDISGNYAIVGSPDYNLGGLFNRGIAYIYQRNILTNTWSEQAILNPPDGGEEDGIFGNRVTISGNIAAVASMLTDNGSSHYVGKVFIYRLVNNVWTHTQTIHPPVIQSYERFGSALTLKSDTLIIGSSQWNGYELSKNGKVYMYINSVNNFQLHSTITATDGKKGDAFGSSLYFENGLLIVGAGKANIGAKESLGKAYIFKLNGSNWEQQAILTAYNGNENDQFGEAVIISNSEAVVSSIQATYQTYLQHGRLYFFEK